MTADKDRNKTRDRAPAPTTVEAPPLSGERVKVFLLDNHEIVRRGVADLIDAEDDLVVIGQWGGAVGAVERIEACAPDVVVIDVRLGDGSGIEVCRDVRSSQPDIGCLILTSFSDDQALVDASLAGAAGYLLKQVRGNHIVDAIRAVAGGAQLLDSATVRLALRRLRESEPGTIADLTPREREILDLIGEGRSNRQIASELFLAEKTVKNYVSNLLAKLGMQRRSEAAAFVARVEERARHRFE
ncbi:MAG TPA: response regulator transcription factor [Ilumatobacteraceae bacterium]|nr:response regulator transcription factor [Ilumatobacteraceae bacterium]